MNNNAYKALLEEGITAQGDLLIVRADLLDEVKDDWEVVVSTSGHHVVAHSETGHHHVLRPLAGALKSPVLWRDPKASNPELRSIVEVPVGCSEIVHMRNNHVHEKHILPPGEWVLIRQQRPTPEGWAVVTD